MTTSPYDNLPTGKKQLNVQNTGYEEVILDTRETSENQRQQTTAAAEEPASAKASENSSLSSSSPASSFPANSSAAGAYASSNNRGRRVYASEPQSLKSSERTTVSENLDTPFLQKISQNQSALRTSAEPDASPDTTAKTLSASSDSVHKNTGSAVKASADTAAEETAKASPAVSASETSSAVSPASPAEISAETAPEKAGSVSAPSENAAIPASETVSTAFPASAITSAQAETSPSGEDLPQRNSSADTYENLKNEESERAQSQETPGYVEIPVPTDSASVSAADTNVSATGEEPETTESSETAGISGSSGNVKTAGNSETAGGLKSAESYEISSVHGRQNTRSGSDILRTTPVDRAPSYSKTSVQNRRGLREYILPFEESLLVPDTMPDMEEIFFTEGRVSLSQNSKTSYEFGDTLSGEITLYTVYRPDDSSESPVDVIKSTIPFKTDRCWSGGDGSSFRVSLSLKSSRAEFINERKFAAKGEISIRLTEIEKKELSVFEGADDSSLITRESTVRVTSLNFETEELAEISQEIKINDEQPEPAKILKETINISEAHKQITSGKLVVNAIINTQILYIGQEEGENKLCSITHKTDFTQFILIKENTDVNLIKADFNGDDLKVSIDNNTGFMLEGQVRILIQGYENKELKTVSDAYHKEKELTFDIAAQPVSSIHETLSGEISAREVINADDASRKPHTLLCGSLQPESISGRLEGSRVIIEGALPVKILALDEEGKPFVIESSVPLRGSLEAPSGSSDCQIDVWTSVKDFWTDNINSRQIEVNVSVMADVWITSNQSFTTIENICFAEKREKEKRVSLAVYVVGRNDTLWEIAKKYKSDMALLAEFNQIDPSRPLPEGMKLLIAK